MHIATSPSQRCQISNLQDRICNNNDFNDDVDLIIELNLLTNIEKIDLSPVENSALTDTDQLGPIKTGDGSSVQVLELICRKTRLQHIHLCIQMVHQCGDKNNMLVECRSTHFDVADKTAHVPFLDHQMLECDCTGREYTNVDHDITLRIPEGAVAEGEKVHFEVGVAMYGPFIFPENTQPISPFLWLCLLEEDIELKKPFQIILPHYLTGLSKEKIEHHQVSFAKANHNDYTFVDNQMTYRFQHSIIAAEPQVLHASSGYRSYGVLVLKHCCFYCLMANKPPELAMDAEYCLVRIESPLSSVRNEVYFAAIYFLDTCLKVYSINFYTWVYYF